MSQRGRTGWRGWVVRGALCVVLGVVTTVGVAWGAAYSQTGWQAAEFRGFSGPGNVYQEPGAWWVEAVSTPLRLRRGAYKAGTGANYAPLVFGPPYDGEARTAPTELHHWNEAWGNIRLRQPPTAGTEDQHLGVEEGCGWPRVVLWCSFGWKQEGSGWRDAVFGGIELPKGKWWHLRALPLRPVWSGIAVDTFVYAVLWWVLLASLGGLASWRRSVRYRRGRCADCGYDLVHKFESGCPECGWNRA